MLLFRILSRVAVVASAALLANCDGDGRRPAFQIAGQEFFVDPPEGFCAAQGLTAMGFEQLASQNADKVLLANFVKCSENDSAKPARTYFSILTLRDPVKMKITQAALFEEETPDIPPEVFAKLLNQNASFDDVKKVPVKDAKSAFGTKGNLLPRARDGLCVYGGGRYIRQDRNGVEVTRSVATCGASIGGRRIAIFYHVDGPVDLMDMTRTVRSLALSLKPVA